jgi:hypothetical protein
MRASEFITETKGKKTDQDTIDLVKMAWDDGKKPKAIATDLGLSHGKVEDLLRRYYTSRPRKVLHLGKALTDEDKTDIVSKFLNNDTARKISRDYGIGEITVIEFLKSKLGIDRYNDEMKKRRTTTGVPVANKITPEMLVKMRELYAAGKTLAYISDHFDNVIRGPNVHNAMKRQPDYAELRAKRDEHTRKVKHSPVATTNKTPAGIDGNLRRKGPGSIHTSGVDWQQLN